MLDSFDMVTLVAALDKNTALPSAHDNSLQYIFPRMGEIDDTDNIIMKLGQRV